jgi:F-type H+-transporting ATPase subunit epsilon
MKQFKLKVITPEKIIYDGLAREVDLPTREGMVGILINHLPYMAPLCADELIIKVGEDENLSDDISLAIDFGLAEFVNDQLTVLVAEAAKAEEIDLDLAQKAKERAQKLMEEKVEDIEGFAQAQALLEREIAKIKVANKYRLKSARLPTS